MPTAPKHACSQPGCRTAAPAGQPKCATHTIATERARGSSTARGYDHRWRKYRIAYLRANPLCVECLKSGPPGGNGKSTPTPATVVDHIRDHKGDETLFWDPENHRSVCKPHHDARTDAGDFGRAT